MVVVNNVVLWSRIVGLRQALISEFFVANSRQVQIARFRQHFNGITLKPHLLCTTAIPKHCLSFAMGMLLYE